MLCSVLLSDASAHSLAAACIFSAAEHVCINNLLLLMQLSSDLAMCGEHVYTDQ